MIPHCIDKKEFRYGFPSDEWMVTQKRYIDKFVNEFIKEKGFEDFHIEIDYTALGNVFVRVDERKDYYLYFHSQGEKSMDVSREKEIALISYWITRYKPFRCHSIHEEEDFLLKYRCTINDVMAAMLIVSYLCEKVPRAKNYFTVEKIELLIYDLLNRDISKEALIMYVESFFDN